MAKKRDELNGFTPTPLVGVQSQRPQDTDGEKKWPNLLACLCPVWREAKCVRQAGSLSIRVVGSVFQVSLSCPTECVETSVRVSTLVDILDVLEKVLSDGTAVWGPDYATAKKARQAKAH